MTTAAVLAGGSVTVALLVARPPSRLHVRHRLGHDAAMPSASWRGVAGGALVVALVVVMSRLGTVRHVLLGVAGVVALSCAGHLRTLRRRSRSRDATRAATTEALDALLAELSAGTPPSVALGHLSRDWPLLASAASAARLGGDVADGLRFAAREPGAEALADLAAAWEVSERSGASQTTVLASLGDSLADDRDTRREVQALLGPTRATARLLAVLPALGLGLGSGLGGSPAHVLLGTTAGAACLVVGCGFACAGLVWVERLAHRAES